MFGKKKAEDEPANDIENINEADRLEDDDFKVIPGEDDELEKQKQLNGELQDKYLRLHAEFDNFRRRTMKEKQDLMAQANKDLLLNILPVFDDFVRAMDVAEKATDTEAIIKGLDLIVNKFKHVLQQTGVKAIESKGEEFDSELHDAITTIPAPTPDLKGKVVDEIQKGYLLNDKVIRHAKVVVGE